MTDGLAQALIFKVVSLGTGKAAGYSVRPPHNKGFCARDVNNLEPGFVQGSDGQSAVGGRFRSVKPLPATVQVDVGRAVDVIDAVGSAVIHRGVADQFSVARRCDPAGRRQGAFGANRTPRFGGVIIQPQP